MILVRRPHILRASCPLCPYLFRVFLKSDKVRSVRWSSVLSDLWVLGLSNELSAPGELNDFSWINVRWYLHIEKKQMFDQEYCELLMQWLPSVCKFLLFKVVENRDWLVDSFRGLIQGAPSFWTEEEMFVVCCFSFWGSLIVFLWSGDWLAIYYTKDRVNVMQ